MTGDQVRVVYIQSESKLKWVADPVLFYFFLSCCINNLDGVVPHVGSLTSKQTCRSLLVNSCQTGLFYSHRHSCAFAVARDLAHCSPLNSSSTAAATPHCHRWKLSGGGARPRGPSPRSLARPPARTAGKVQKSRPGARPPCLASLFWLTARCGEPERRGSLLWRIPLDQSDCGNGSSRRARSAAPDLQRSAHPGYKTRGQ